MKYMFPKKVLRRPLIVYYASFGVIIVVLIIFFVLKVNGGSSALMNYLLMGAFAIFYPLVKITNKFVNKYRYHIYVDDMKIVKKYYGSRLKIEMKYDDIMKIDKLSDGIVLEGKYDDMEINKKIEKFDELYNFIMEKIKK